LQEEINQKVQHEGNSTPKNYITRKCCQNLGGEPKEAKAQGKVRAEVRSEWRGGQSRGEAGAEVRPEWR